MKIKINEKKAANRKVVAYGGKMTNNVYLPLNNDQFISLSAKYGVVVVRIKQHELERFDLYSPIYEGDLTITIDL